MEIFSKLISHFFFLSFFPSFSFFLLFPPLSSSLHIAQLGRSSDVWSLGCILYQMTYGTSPFSHLQLAQAVRAITDDNYVIPFPPHCNKDLIAVIKKCLQRNPRNRPTVEQLLAVNPSFLSSLSFLCFLREPCVCFLFTPLFFYG